MQGIARRELRDQRVQVLPCDPGVRFEHTIDRFPAWLVVFTVHEIRTRFEGVSLSDAHSSNSRAPWGCRPGAIAVAAAVDPIRLPDSR